MYRISVGSSGRAPREGSRLRPRRLETRRRPYKGNMRNSSEAVLQCRDPHQVCGAPQVGAYEEMISPRRSDVFVSSTIQG